MDPEVFNAAEGGKLELNLNSVAETSELQFSARLKYFGFQNWTQWMTPEPPHTGSALYLNQNIITLLPVILTSCVVVLTLLTSVTVCIVKKKRSEIKYEAELRKVEEHCQDIQKHLNDKYFI